MGHILHHQGLPLDEELLHEEHRRDVEKEALGEPPPHEAAGSGEESA